MKWAASMINFFFIPKLGGCHGGMCLAAYLNVVSEVQIVLSDTTSDLENRFTDEMWLSRLVFLEDIFCRLNELNKSLQGFRTTPFSVHDKKAFRKILGFIIKEVESGQVSSFPFLDSFISEDEIQLNPELAANKRSIVRT
jgi:hypothetical protein